MPIFFPGSAGQVVQLAEPAIACELRGAFRTDPAMSFTKENAILTRAELNPLTNTQFQHAFGPYVYVYNFGDATDDLTLAGIGFSACACPTNSNGEKQSGFEAMYNWYKKNRVSTRDEPITVTFGDVAIKGFLISSSFRVVDPNTNISEWFLAIKTIPNGID